MWQEGDPHHTRARFLLPVSGLAWPKHCKAPLLCLRMELLLSLPLRAHHISDFLLCLTLRANILLLECMEIPPNGRCFQGSGFLQGELQLSCGKPPVLLNPHSHTSQAENSPCKALLCIPGPQNNLRTRLQTPIDCFTEDSCAYPDTSIYLCSFGEYIFLWMSVEALFNHGLVAFLAMAEQKATFCLPTFMATRSVAVQELSEMHSPGALLH